MLIVKCTCSYSPWHRLSPTDDPLQLHFLFYSSGPVMTMMVRLIVFPSLLLLTPSQIQLVVCAERKKAKKPCATTKHTNAENFLALLIPSLDGCAIVLRFSSCLYVSTVYI